MKFVFTLALVFAVGHAASAANLPKARIAVARVATQTDQLVGDCEQIAAPANQIKKQLADLSSSLNSFVPDPDIEDVLINLGQGIDAVDFALVECVSYRGQDYSDGKNLLDMYLSHIDIDLMLAEHGVDANGNRQR